MTSERNEIEVLASAVEETLHRVYQDHADYRITTTMIRDMAEAVVRRLSRAIAAGKVAALPDGYRIEVQHGDEQWMTTAYTLVTPDKRRWSPAPMEPGYYLLAALYAPPADPAKASAPDMAPQGELACEDCGGREFGVYNKATATLFCRDCGQIAELRPKPASAPEVTGYQLSLSEANRLIDAHDEWIAEADSIGADWSGNAAKLEKLHALTAALQQEGKSHV
jgi:hypothetical protein